jgi:hypothetical protein
MNITTLINNIGKKVDIVDGSLILSDTGFLTITTSPIPNSIYINKLLQNYMVIVPKGEYRGHTWNLVSSNCATICTKWAKENIDIDLVDWVSNFTYEQKIIIFREGYLKPFEELKFEKIEYTNIDALNKGNILIYEYPNHIGVYIGNNQILHHKRNKLSSIDIVDPSKILGIYTP